MNHLKKLLLTFLFFTLLTTVLVKPTFAQVCPEKCSETTCASTGAEAPPCCVKDPSDESNTKIINCTQLVQVNRPDIGFQIPTFSVALTFMIRFFFVIAGIAALFYMLWGAFDYVISGGDEKKTGGAQKKITSAVIGIFFIIAALVIIVTLEQLIFKKTICFGLTCPVQLPDLLKPCSDSNNDGKCDENI